MAGEIYTGAVKACAWCERMKRWYEDVTNPQKSAGIYMQFGAILYVSRMRNGRQIHEMIDKTFASIAFCPLCGANIKKRIREWEK